METANAISLSFVAGVAVPAGLWFLTGSMWYAGLAIAVLAQAVAIEAIKPHLVRLGPWAQRPASARGCDMLCVGGPVGGAPGFPSGHMAAATLLVVALWFHTRRPVVLWVGVPWIGAMAWARWYKGCHSLVQIMGGAAVGGAMGMAYAHVIGV